MTPTKTKPVVGQKGAQLKQAHQRWQQGVEATKGSDWARATAMFRLATKAAPLDTLYRLNLARALVRIEQPQEAIVECERIIKLEPANVLVRQFLADLYIKAGCHNEAIECLQGVPDSVALDVAYLDLLCNTLFAASRFEEAVGACLRLLSLRVDHAPTHYRLGLCFHALGMKAEMVECLGTAVLMGEPSVMLASRSLLAFVNRELCRWGLAEPEIREMNALIDQLPADAALWSSVFASVTLTDDPRRHFRSARACAHYFEQGVQPLPAQAGRRIPHRIRLGMVSCDFHQHATTILMAELLERLDPERFEVHLYSYGPDDGSPMRQRIKDAAHAFTEIGKLSDLQTAQRIRADEIDVLIDLKGHTSRSRLGIFAYRPARLQVTYLGFPGTTGARFMDYLIGDAIVSPLSQADHYSEKLALMPQCYQPNDRMRALPAPTSRAEHGLPPDALVLCGFNQPFKLSPEVFDLWCGLLKELPQAVLWLLRWNQESEAPLREEAARRGIDPARLVFAPALHSAQHISRFALADIFLDAWPCNGHTTVSDALWAAVPVVTYEGRSFAARVASSLLHAVGMQDCVTTDLASYRQKVLSLAHDAPQRQQLRERLVAARDTAPLFDTDRYAADFGALILRMVARAADGLPPEHLPARVQEDPMA